MNGKTPFLTLSGYTGTLSPEQPTDQTAGRLSTPKDAPPSPELLRPFWVLNLLMTNAEPLTIVFSLLLQHNYRLFQKDGYHPHLPQSSATLNQFCRKTLKPPLLTARIQQRVLVPFLTLSYVMFTKFTP